MAYNAKVELIGNLGADAKCIEKEGKTFVALSLATKDSYPVKEGENTVWKDNQTTLWHQVLIFRPMAMEIAKTLKSGDRVEISGSLSYRSIQGEDGYKHQEATIIGRFVSKVEFGKSEEPSEEELSQISGQVSQAA